MKPTILIVDDEPTIREIIESILANKNYSLEYAANGRAALKQARALRPDLILLDLMMPDMDGMEVCQQIRKDPDLAEVPIVMITALDDRNLRIACLDAGADDFITKPFDSAELRARVGTIMRLNRYRLLHERNLITSWITEQATDGYLQVHADDRILFANPRARFYLGLDIDQNKPIHESFMEIVSRQYTLRPESAWAGWTSFDMNVALDRYLVRPESNAAHEFWLETSVFETSPKEGLPRTRIIRLRDVTADVLNRRNTRSFGEAITHKIRTPVTHMVSSLDLLVRQAPKLSPDQIAKFADTALHGAQRLYKTLDRILKYSNLRSAPDNADGFPLSELAEFVEKISIDIGLAHVTVAVAEDARAARLTLPVQPLEVLFWELFDNSKKFHPAGWPTVKVEALRKGPRQIALRISDDGISLSPKQLTIAMLPYYQGEKYFTGEAPGMGLGLPTVNTIVWGVGGDCRLFNRENGPGVIVELTLPAVDER